MTDIVAIAQVFPHEDGSYWKNPVMQLPAYNYEVENESGSTL